MSFTDEVPYNSVKVETTVDLRKELTRLCLKIPYTCESGYITYV